MRYCYDMILETKVKNGRHGGASPVAPVLCGTLLSHVSERNGVVKSILTYASRNSAGAETWTHADLPPSNSSRVRWGTGLADKPELEKVWIRAVMDVCWGVEGRCGQFWEYSLSALTHGHPYVSLALAGETSIWPCFKTVLSWVVALTLNKILGLQNL